MAAPPASLRTRPQPAGAAAAAAAKPAQPVIIPGRTRRASRLAWVLAFMALPAGVVALPSAILLVIGLTPTLVALLIDREPEKYAAATVGSLNFCGVMPALITLWQTGHTLGNALSLLGKPFLLLPMFALAALGWLIYFAVPPVVMFVMTLQARRELKRLRDRQEKLIEDWGDAVAGNGIVD